MIMAFLVTWVSFTANVNENIYELGILRAVGLNDKQVLIVYIFEALSVVLSSLILSTLIGLALSLLLTLTDTVWTTLPFKFYFPYTLFLILLCAGVFIAVVAAWLPTRHVVKQTVSQNLRSHG